jgi:hypothetical protein
MSLMKCAWLLGLPIALASAAPSSGASAAAAIHEKCVKSDADFKPTAPSFWFEVALKNSCAVRVICKVEASVTDYKGVHTGAGEVWLAPGSAARPASGAYRLRVGAPGGMGNSGVTCRPI